MWVLERVFGSYLSNLINVYHTSCTWLIMLCSYFLQSPTVALVVKRRWAQLPASSMYKGCEGGCGNGESSFSFGVTKWGLCIMHGIYKDTVMLTFKITESLCIITGCTLHTAEE